MMGLLSKFRQRVFDSGIRHWVYEVDNFMGTEITPQAVYNTSSRAIRHRSQLQTRMGSLGQYLSYKIIVANKGESFKDAYIRVTGDKRSTIMREDIKR